MESTTPAEEYPSTAPAPEPGAPAGDGLLPSMGGLQCARCGSPLAADQRYCVECGERHGEPRLPFMDGRPPSGPDEPPSAAAAGRPRFSSGATLIAGLATLLIALGVGVLIGHAGKGNDSPASAAKTPPLIVTVPSGGGSAAPAAAAAAGAAAGATKAAHDSSAKSGSSASKKASSDTGSKSSSTKSSSTPAKAATRKAAPTKVSGAVKQGDKGSGPGYKKGKFTGDFFGG